MERGTLNARVDAVHAVIVSFSGEDLHSVIAAVGRQLRQPERVTVVLVGPMKDRGQEVAGALREHIEGGGAVVTVPQAKNFGEAIRQAMTSRPLEQPAGWYWLLHDDSAPEPDALFELAAQSTLGGTIALVGPKQVAWEDPQKVLEVGIEVTRSGRRADLTAPEEIDQGQYDGRQDVLAVGTAGMLVNAGVWKETRGLDPHLGPFGDGLEYGRRLRLAGYRVVVAPKASVRHRQRALDRSSGGAGSFQARREAQLYNWLLTVPGISLPVLLVLLAPWALMRALARLVARQPRVAGAEIGSYLQLLAATPALGRARRRLRRGSTIPQSALTDLEMSRRELSERQKKHRRIARSKMSDSEQVSSPTALAWAQYRRRARFGFFGLISVAALISLVAWYPYIGGISGAAWADLPTSAGALWQQAWVPWVFGGSGAPGPVNPLLPLLALLSYPLSVMGAEPTQVALAVMILALPAAATTGWWMARMITRSVPLSFGAAALWAAHPAFLFALTLGNLPAALIWVALPLVVVGLWRATRTLPSLRLRGVEDVYLLPQPSPIVGAGIASLGLLVVAAGAPGLVLVAALFGYLLAALPNLGAARQLPATDLVTPAGSPFGQPDGRMSLTKRLLLVTLVWVPAAVVTIPTWAWALAHLTEPRQALLALFDPAGLTVAGKPDLGLIVAGIPFDMSAGTLWGITGVAAFVWALISVAATSWQRTRRGGKSEPVGQLESTEPARPWLVRGLFFAGTLIAAALAVFYWAEFHWREVPASPWLISLLSIAAASWILAGLAGTKAQVVVSAEEASRRFQFRRQLSAVILGVIAVTSAMGIFFVGPFGNPSDPQTVVATGGYQAPIIAKQASQSDRVGRLLVLSTSDGQVRADLWRVASRNQTDLSWGLRQADSEAYQVAQDNLAVAAGTLAAHPSSAPATVLADHNVEFVLVPPSEPEGAGTLTGNIDASVGFERIGTTEAGTMWRVRPASGFPAWAKLVEGADQTSTVVPAGPTGVKTSVAVAKPSTLVIAEPADPQWRATFDGTLLESTADPDVDAGWRQAFLVPAGEGALAVGYEPVWKWWWVGASALAVLVAVVAAVPFRRRRELWAVDHSPSQDEPQDEPQIDGLEKLEDLDGDADIDVDADPPESGEVDTGTDDADEFGAGVTSAGGAPQESNNETNKAGPAATIGDTQAVEDEAE